MCESSTSTSCGTTASDAGLEGLAAAALHVLGYGIAVITRSTDAGEHIIANAGTTRAEDSARAPSGDDLLALCAQVTATGEQLVLGNSAGHAAPPPLHFFAGLPLRASGGCLLGVLALAATAPRDGIAPADLAVLAHLAAAAGRLIELQAHAARNQVLADIGSLTERLLTVTSESADFPSAMSAVADTLISVTGAAVCHFYRLAPDNRTVLFVGSSGRDAFRDNAFIAALHVDPLTTENSQIGAALISEFPIIVTELTKLDLNQHPRSRRAVELGLKVGVIIQIDLDGVRYAGAVSFATVPAQLDDIIAVLREASPVLRALMRRLRDHDQAVLLRRAIEVSPDPFIITEGGPIAPPGPRIVYVNPAFTADSGYTAEEVIGRSPRMLFGDSTAVDGRAAIRDALDQRQPVRQELLVHRKDGTTLWSDVNIAPVTDSSGWLANWVAVSRDTTAHHIAAERQREAARELEMLIDELPGGLQRLRQTANGDWDHSYSSPAIERLFGLSLEAFAARAYCNHFSPGDLAVLRDAMMRAITVGHATAEVPYHHPNGQICVVHGSFRANPRADGIREVIAIWSDVTEERERMAQIAHAGRLATLGEMASGLAHELNQPLTTISLLAETGAALYADGAGDGPSMQGLCDRIVRQTQRAGKIIQNLRDFTLPIAGGNVPVAIIDAVNAAIGLIGSSLSAHGVLLEVALPADLPLVLGEVVRIEQVLLNLLGNARDALQAAGVRYGKIRLSACVEGDRVLLDVEDNAGGIPTALIERVFTPFFTTKDMSTGTGLGLSICRSAMRAMEGAITVRNGSEGAVFSLSFARAAT